ncbi:unnamed protein product, partial [Rotaria socialis]
QHGNEQLAQNSHTAGSDISQGSTAEGMNDEIIQK